MANTFALIVSGRLVQSNFEQVETTKFLITIPNTDTINHLVVFMTGMVPLPDGHSGAVYFSFPDPNSPPSWIYLGYIDNGKPSAIFKINKLKKMSSNETNVLGFNYQQSIISNVGQIGISIEPTITVQQMSADPTVSTTSAEETATKFEQFATKMAENLFNYCTSFSNTLQYFATQPNVNPNQQMIPMTTINEWYQKFLRNFKQNPNFWR